MLRCALALFLLLQLTPSTSRSVTILNNAARRDVNGDYVDACALLPTPRRTAVTVCSLPSAAAGRTALIADAARRCAR